MWFSSIKSMYCHTLIFDVEKCKKNILYRNPNAKIFEVCAKTGEGIDDWCKWLENEVKAWKE